MNLSKEQINREITILEKNIMDNRNKVYEQTEIMNKTSKTLDDLRNKIREIKNEKNELENQTISGIDISQKRLLSDLTLKISKIEKKIEIEQDKFNKADKEVLDYLYEIKNMSDKIKEKNEELNYI